MRQEVVISFILDGIQAKELENAIAEKFDLMHIQSHRSLWWVKKHDKQADDIGSISTTAKIFDLPSNSSQGGG